MTPTDHPPVKSPSSRPSRMTSSEPPASSYPATPLALSPGGGGADLEMLSFRMPADIADQGLHRPVATETRSTPLVGGNGGAPYRHGDFLPGPFWRCEYWTPAQATAQCSPISRQTGHVR